MVSANHPKPGLLWFRVLLVLIRGVDDPNPFLSFFKKRPDGHRMAPGWFLQTIS